MSSYHHLVFEADAVIGEEDMLHQAMTLTLKYGKHQGKSVQQLVVTPEGRDYLRWMVRDASIQPAMKQKIQCALSFAEQQLKKS